MTSSSPSCLPSLQPKIVAPKLIKPSAAGGKKAQNVYTIDCTKPAEDRIFDVAGFEKYLHDNMKVDGKPGQLGNLVDIARVGESSASFLPALAHSVHSPALLDRIKLYHAPLSRLHFLPSNPPWLRGVPSFASGARFPACPLARVVEGGSKRASGTGGGLSRGCGGRGRGTALVIMISHQTNL